VRRPDARSAQIRRPAGVTLSFQVSEYSIEPSQPITARNLLAKHDWRATLADETEHVRPEVSLVFFAFSLSGDAEGLTGAASGPDGPVVWPSSQS
jgi:hypothetical protein